MTRVRMVMAFAWWSGPVPPRHDHPTARSNPEPSVIADRVDASYTPAKRNGPTLGTPTRTIARGPVRRNRKGVSVMPSVGIRPHLALAPAPHVAPEAAA